MSIGQAILLFIFSSISGIGSSTEEFQTHRPIIAASLAGFALGDLKTGVMAGAAMEFIALGWMSIGASIPPDPALAGVVVAILAILGKQSIGVAVSMAIPIAIAGQLLQITQMSVVNVAIMHWAERGIEKGKFYRITAAHLLTAIPAALRVAVLSLIIAHFADASIVQNWLNSIPKPITMGLQVSSGFLVIVGYAMIMQLLNVKELLPFFIIGFLALTFTNMTLVGLTLFGVSLTIIYYNVSLLAGAGDSRGRRQRTEEKSVKTKEKNLAISITKKDLMKVFWRTQIFQLSWNFERFQNLCYCFAIYPILKKLYKTKEELYTAVKVHLEYYNSHPYFASAILGVNIAMEEAKANGETIDERDITEVKIALMGPFAGIGDPVFWGTIRPMMAAIGAGIASTGDVVGAILFFALINSVRFFMRYNVLMTSYKRGVSMISQLKNFMPKVKNIMTVLSYTIIGGLVAKWTSINVSFVLYSYVKDGKLVKATVQQQLDGIMPNLLPLLLTFFIYWLLKKKISPLLCMIGLMLLGIVGYGLGILM